MRESIGTQFIKILHLYFIAIFLTFYLISHVLGYSGIHIMMVPSKRWNQWPWDA